MTGMHEREKALENKYFHDEELKFRMISRRRKLLGLWAAEAMNMPEDQRMRYALDIVAYGIENTEDGAVVNRLLADFARVHYEITEKDVRKKMRECEQIALQQIQDGI